MNDNETNNSKPQILWIHGFAGKPDNDTVKEMRKRYPEYDFYSIEVDHHALASMEKINAYIESHRVDLVAGTSLGGFYAACARFDGPKFVVNPGVNHLRELRQFLGENTYKPGRPDGQSMFVFTEEMLNEFGQLKMEDLGRTLCHYTPHDQVLGEEMKEHYEKLFASRKEIDEKILPGHFLTFKYVKTEFGEALRNILSRNEAERRDEE